MAWVFWYSTACPIIRQSSVVHSLKENHCSLMHAREEASIRENRQQKGPLIQLVRARLLMPALWASQPVLRPSTARQYLTTAARAAADPRVHSTDPLRAAEAKLTAPRTFEVPTLSSWCLQPMILSARSTNSFHHLKSIQNQPAPQGLLWHPKIKTLSSPSGLDWT